MENTIVEARSLEKIFRDFWGKEKARAVNGINFSIGEGEVCGLLGPNGSGKTTTIKMILGLLYPTGGSLKVFGQSPRNVEIKKRIGYLPEETYLYKYLTARETISFFASLFNIPSEERTRRTEQLLEMVGLTHAANRPIGEFSKGMARRIGLAQALVNDPDLVILDEPTTGLDPIGCREIKDLIKMLAKRGKSVLLSSHLLADVEDLCDNVVVLYGGEIRAEGTLKNLLKEKGKTQILTPDLDKEMLDKILKILKTKHTNKDVLIDNPAMSLEDFFVRVVEEAKSSSKQTSGAETRGEFADYLFGKDSEEKARSEEMLKKLLEGREKINIETKKEKIAHPPKNKIAVEKLERLSEKKKPQKIEEKKTKAYDKKIEHENKRINELLNTKK